MQDKNENTEDQDENEVEGESPKNHLAAFQNLTLKRKLILIAVLAIMTVIVSFFMFFNDDSSKKNEAIKPMQLAPLIDDKIDNVYQQAEVKNQPKIDNKIIELQAPTPPPPPMLENLQKITPEIKSEINKNTILAPALPISTPKKSIYTSIRPAKDDSISITSVMAFGGGGDKVTTTEKKDTQNKEEFLGFDGGTMDNSILKPTSAKSVIATKINNDLRYSIIQGKVIDAVLETAINTQLATGIIRAIVSRDVYGEQGDLILIPKGSRLVGSYGASSSTAGGGGAKVLTRVYAGWNRIITPNGVDISLSATPATDTLGRSGIPGYLDTNLTNNLLNAFLVSILGPYLVAEISGISKQQTTTSQNTDGKGNDTTSTTGSVGSKVLSDGITQFQNVGKEQLDKLYPSGVTTVFIDQGTRIDIVVQEDIVFPKQAITSNSSAILP